jgi:hypothetical protein
MNATSSSISHFQAAREMLPIRSRETILTNMAKVREAMKEIGKLKSKINGPDLDPIESAQTLEMAAVAIREISASAQVAFTNRDADGARSVFAALDELASQLDGMVST